MRKYGMRCLEIFHAFLLLAGVYQILAVLIGRYDTVFFAKSFILLPIVLLFSAAVERVRQFWQFFGAVVLAEVCAGIVTEAGFERIWMLLCVGAAAVLYFMGRAMKQKCWLEQPFYPWLLFYLLFYILGRRVESELAVYYASFGAGIYYLICNFYTNLRQVDTFVRTHAQLERFPAKRLGRINQWMMWSVSGIIALAMMSAPFLKLDEIIRTIGAVIRKGISWLLQLLPDGGEEAGQAVKEAARQLPPMGPAKEPSLFWEILYKLMDLLGWLFALALTLWALRWALLRLLRWYRRFHEVVEENGDRIERLQAEPGAEKKRRIEREKKEHLFWDRSFNARIRKHYKKKVLQDWKKAPGAGLTPQEIAEGTSLADRERALFLQYYEKARYGQEPCSKDEMREMLNIR